jgi:bifunctional oligoribonuclease and PAP phosphatase NrnA
LPSKPEHKKLAHKVLNFIGRHDDFLLSAHINADGDAIAAVLALSLLLERLNKKYEMVLHDQEPDIRFNYLKNFEKIIHYSDRLKINSTCAIILDVPGIKRIGDVQKLLPAKSRIVRIDHHPTEDEFAGLDMVDERASSTTQLIYEIIELAKVEIDQALASAIYTGIVYDTGRFSFSNTTARDMYICGKMIELGVDPAEINNRIFFENSFDALRTIGKGLASMESHLNGAVNIVYLDYGSMKNNNQGEIDELANYSVAIRGGQVGLFIREIEAGLHKISLRSKGKVDVNQVAKVFNGGGHARAAGCRIQGSKAEVIKLLLAEIEKRL